MQSEALTVVWVYHKNIFTEWASIPTIQGAVLTLTGLDRPPYEVEYWDTMEARIVSRARIARSGDVRLTLPPVRRDLAVKVRAVSSRR